MNWKSFNVPYSLCVCYSDAGIREAECEKSAMDVKYSTDTKIEDNSRMFKLQKAHFDQEINTAVSWIQENNLEFQKKKYHIIETNHDFIISLNQSEILIPNCNNNFTNLSELFPL